MQIICEQNEEGMLICEIPETEKIETLQEVETDTGSFYVDTSASYGELMISYLFFRRAWYFSRGKRNNV